MCASDSEGGAALVAGGAGLVSLGVPHWSCSAMCRGFYASLATTSLMAVRVGNDS